MDWLSFWRPTFVKIPSIHAPLQKGPMDRTQGWHTTTHLIAIRQFLCSCLYVMICVNSSIHALPRPPLDAFALTSNYIHLDLPFQVSIVFSCLFSQMSHRCSNPPP